MGKLINEPASLQTESVFSQFLFIIVKDFTTSNTLSPQGMELIAVIFCKRMTEEQKH